LWRVCLCSVRRFLLTALGACPRVWFVEVRGARGVAGLSVLSRWAGVLAVLR